MLSAHPSGFYRCVKNPLSDREVDDARQTVLVQGACKESGKIYGYRKLHDDLVEMGERVSANRIARLARLEGIQAQIGYEKPSIHGGKSSAVGNNTSDWQFCVDAPGRAWVTDITDSRTNEGFAYLCAAAVLYARRVVDWVQGSRPTTELAVQALLTAIWRRKPTDRFRPGNAIRQS